MTTTALRKSRKAAKPRAEDPAPVDLAQRVQDAFRRSVRAAVVGHIERGEVVVGQVDGVWREVRAEDLKDYLGNNR